MYNRLIARTIANRWFQLTCQTVALLGINGHYDFFRTWKIYQGKLKSFCVPVLNCHSCPLALYACPIGALQFFFMTGRLPVYLLSIISIFGISLGRMGCGLLCPFGFLQDFLFRLGKVRIEIPGYWFHLKYAVLFGVVIALSFYLALPAFCKICPVALLEAGFPLAFLEEEVAGRLFNQSSGMFTGWMFLIKTFLLTSILIASLSIKRPFCRIFCPLGALLGLFNRFSIIHIHVDYDTCNNCERCERMCPVDLNITRNSDSAECVRCMKCTSCKSISTKLRLLPLPFVKNA